MTNQKAKAGVFSSALWVGSSRLIVRFLGTVSTIVLARILVPEDFGLIAVVVGLSSMLEEFSQFGFNQALIHFKKPTDEDYASAWSMNICRGVILSILVFVLSFPVAEYLNDGRYLALLQVVACLPFIKGLENVKFIEFDKNMQFNVVFKVMVITKVLGVITTISLAILWRNYWVLIAGMIVTAITRVTLTYYYAPLITQFTFQSWRKLFKFSGWLFGAEVMGSLSSRLEPLILTVIFSPVIVGVVHVAREISQLTNEIAAPLRRVLFPALSRYKANTPEFIEMYKKSVAGLFMIMAPACFGFALVTPRFIPLLLGDKWLDTIPYIQLLAIIIGITVIGRTAQSAIMAAGKTKTYFYRAALFLPIRLSLITLGATFYGESGLMVALFCAGIILSILNISMAKQVTNLGLLRHIGLIKRFVPSLIGMLAVLKLLELYLLQSNGHMWMDIFNLFVLIMLGGITYLALTLLIWQILGKPHGPEQALISVFINKRKKIILG